MIAFLSCKRGHPRADNELFRENFDSVAKQFCVPPEDVPLKVLEKVPSYFGLLKTGMSPGEVFRTLHLPKVRLTGGEHTARNYTLGIELRTNRYLVLRFNMLSNPPCYLGGALAGDGWKQASPTNGSSSS
jgi:hypothetical protein